MTPEELAELERLAGAATSGPWAARTVLDGGGCTWDVIEANGNFDFATLDRPQDAAFIAAARSAVPALIAWGRGLERYNGELGQHLKEVVDERDAAIARAETAERARDELHREYGILMRIHSEAEQALGARAEQAERERDTLQRHYDAAGPEHNLLALLDLYHEQKVQAERERDEAITNSVRLTDANDREPAGLRTRLAEVSQERDALVAQAAAMREALEGYMNDPGMARVEAALALDAGRALLAEREAERAELAVLREALALLLARRQPRGGAGGQTITSSTCWACRADFANPSTAVSPLCPACERRDAVAEGHAALAKLNSLKVKP